MYGKVDGDGGGRQGVRRLNAKKKKRLKRMMDCVITKQSRNDSQISVKKPQNTWRLIRTGCFGVYRGFHDKDVVQM